jgi:hypothetical protein
MLVTPATVAKRVKDFILEDGPPLNALLALDETLDRILLDVEHGVYGLARGAHFNSTGGGDDVFESEAKKPKLEGKFDGGGETLLAKVWGLAASNHGITVDPTGNTYAWGSQIATYFQVAHPTSPTTVSHALRQASTARSATSGARTRRRAGKEGASAHTSASTASPTTSAAPCPTIGSKPSTGTR